MYNRCKIVQVVNLKLIKIKVFTGCKNVSVQHLPLAQYHLQLALCYQYSYIQRPEEVDITQVDVLPAVLCDQDHHDQAPDGLQVPHHLHSVRPDACLSTLPQTPDAPGASQQIVCTLILRPPHSDQSLVPLHIDGGPATKADSH